MKHPKMRAKMAVQTVTSFVGGDTLKLHGVAAKSYPEDGSDEDNTFAKFSPSVTLDITVMNPALVGTFKAGDTFYVDFTPVD